MRPFTAARRLTCGSLYLGYQAKHLKDMAPRTMSGKAKKMSSVFGNLLQELGIHVALEGSLPNEPSLIVSNHLSYLDPMMLTSALPSIPIAKREVSRWPLIGPCAKQVGVIFTNRSDLNSRAEALNRAEAVLNQGVSVLNFPEGTTTDGSVVLPFHRGSFGLASRLGIPVLPVALSFSDIRLTWTGKQLFVPHLLKLATLRNARATITVGEPVVATNRSAEDVSQECRTAICRLLFSNKTTTQVRVAVQLSDENTLDNLEQPKTAQADLRAL